MVDGFVEIGDLFLGSQCYVDLQEMISFWMLEDFSTGCQKKKKKVVSWNAMLSAFVQYLQIDEAVKLVTDMSDKNAVSWTTMINGYFRVGKLKEARDLLDSVPCEMLGPKLQWFQVIYRMEDLMKNIKFRFD